jgi:TRAP-type C4-dicarboxylate transport system permease small subunit
LHIEGRREPPFVYRPDIANRSRPMDSFVRIVRRISQLCGIVAAALIALGVLVVCHMVFVRYVLNQNTIWQTDLVNVDVLPHYLAPRARFWLALFAASVSLAFSVTLAVLTFNFCKEAWDHRWVSDTMWRARLWIPYSSMPIGLGLLSLQYVADIWNLVTGREPPFGITKEREA